MQFLHLQSNFFSVPFRNLCFKIINIFQRKLKLHFPSGYFCSINRVKSINWSTLNCSALLSRISSVEISAGKFSPLRALRNVFLRLLKPCFTTLKNSFSEHGNAVLSFLVNRITPDLTLGSGLKT